MHSRRGDRFPRCYDDAELEKSAYSFSQNTSKLEIRPAKQDYRTSSKLTLAELGA
jgi:hypothetical protein